VGIPVKFAREPGRVSFAVPAHGEHGEAVLAAAGFSAASIDALRAQGALGH
jgi:crotonobetainyl-CoA:carnitine CoA-transferase CaiB-like acyl-CoA transferase